jgi:tripartite-type tricarboxylate transporter receptor subunit TctC
MSKLVTLLAFALTLMPASASAQGDYPNRPVRMIAAAAPGGNPDVMARLLSHKLSGAFGKPFVVENVPGAGGVVAAKMVAAAPPDGHVLMLGDPARSRSTWCSIPISAIARSRTSPRSPRW